MKEQAKPVDLGVGLQDSEPSSGTNSAVSALSSSALILASSNQTPQSIFYDFIVNDLIKNQVVLESKTHKILREAILGLAAPVGFSGNWLYYKWSWDFVFENMSEHVPYQIRAFLAVLLIYGNGTTNGILTTKPLMEILYDILKPHSKEEKAIYHSEIHNVVRTFYLTSAFILSVGGQISPAYLVYYQTNLVPLAVLLIASNMGYTWKSFYWMFCDWHVSRKFTNAERMVVDAKGYFKNYILGIQNEIVRYHRNKNSANESMDIVKLVEALGRGTPRFDALISSRNYSEPNIQEILRALYNFQSRFPEDKETLPEPLSNTENLIIYITAKVFFAFFMMFYWYGGGAAGKELFGGDAGFYTIALFSIFCVFYLTDIYMHASVRGGYISAKNFFQDKEEPNLAAQLFPQATMAWTIFSVVTSLLSWAFGARHVQVAFVDWLKPWCLSIGMIAVVFLLGYSMIAITKPAVFWWMKKTGSATDDELKLMLTDEKLEQLIKMVQIATPAVFAEFIEKVFASFPVIENSVDLHDVTRSPALATSNSSNVSDPRFYIMPSELAEYFRSHPKKTDTEKGITSQWTDVSSVTSATSDVPLVEKERKNRANSPCFCTVS